MLVFVPQNVPKPNKSFMDIFGFRSVMNEVHNIVNDIQSHYKDGKFGRGRINSWVSTGTLTIPFDTTSGSYPLTLDTGTSGTFQITDSSGANTVATADNIRYETSPDRGQTVTVSGRIKNLVQ